MKRYTIILLLATALPACDKGETTAQAESAPTGQNDKSSTTIADTSGSKAAAEAVVSGTATAQVIEKPEYEAPGKEKRKLNLSLPRELPAASGDELTQEEVVLPDMFEKTEARMQVGGGVHRDEESTDMIRSINGAEVSIDIKTD